MTPKTWCAYFVAAGMIGISLAAASTFGSHPRPNNPPQPGKARVVLEDTGLSDCIFCHKDPGGRPSIDLVRLTESKNFDLDSRIDPHARAYEALKSDLSKKMAERLGYENAAERAECLTCHAVTKQTKDETYFVAQYGVSCEVCHGWRLADESTQKQADWYNPHSVATWRTVSPQVKKEKGQFDLRDPEVRATKCVSCHVGNMEEGKFLTHAMYAAGHPPLLPYEQYTFGRDQPAHWDPPEKIAHFNDGKNWKDPKTPFNDENVDRLFHYRRGQDSTARSLAIGALVNLRETARLIADEAAAKGSLDFAQFDCYACHHELTLPSARQERGYPGIAGRPPIRPLPTELVEAVLKHAESQGQAANRVNEMNAAIKALNDAVTDQPFGDAQKVAKAARALQEWADKCLADLNKVKYTPDAVAGLARQIAARPSHPWDYDAAQLMTWAGRALKADLPPHLDKMVLPSAGLPPDQKSSDIFDHRLRVRYGFQPGEFLKAWPKTAEK